MFRARSSGRITSIRRDSERLLGAKVVSNAFAPVAQRYLVAMTLFIRRKGAYSASRTARPPCAVNSHAKKSNSAFPHPSQAVFVLSPFFSTLSVRLLVAGTSAGTAELLGLASSVVGDEEGTVVGDEGLLELVLAVLVDVLLVVGDLKARY